MQFQFKSGAMTYIGEVGEAKGPRGIFDAIGKLRNVLSPGPCGVCNSQNTFPASKKIKEDVYYEHVCGDCTATRRVVLMDDGRMFVSLKGKDKQPLPNGGWSVYKPKASNGDGFHEPPSRQVSDPPGKTHTNDDEIPW